MGLFNYLVKFFADGGFWMWPILLVGGIGVAIAVERHVKLNKVRKANKVMWDQLQPVLAAGDFDKAREMTENDDSTVSRLLALGLARQGAVRRREDIEIAMEEGMMEIIPQLETRTPYLGLFANIVTLLGLLGTVMGLIEAFTAVAHAAPSEKADLLAAAISVGMNTTAFGLMWGIPLMMLHSFTVAKTGAIVDSLEMASVKTLNIISNASRRAQAAANEKAA
jgi:biopolymer transport protein ExbB